MCFWNSAKGSTFILGSNQIQKTRRCGFQLGSRAWRQYKRKRQQLPNQCAVYELRYRRSSFTNSNMTKDSVGIEWGGKIRIAWDVGREYGFVFWWDPHARTGAQHTPKQVLSTYTNSVNSKKKNWRHAHPQHTRPRCAVPDARIDYVSALNEARTVTDGAPQRNITIDTRQEPDFNEENATD